MVVAAPMVCKLNRQSRTELCSALATRHAGRWTVGSTDLLTWTPPTPPTLPDPPQTLLPRLHPDLSIVRGGLKDRGHARVSGWVGAAGAALGLIVAGP